MDETAVQLEREPPETVASDLMKSVAASESVKVRVAVSPELRDATLELTAMVGGVVSTSVTLMVTVAVSEVDPSASVAVTVSEWEEAVS